MKKAATSDSSIHAAALSAAALIAHQVGGKATRDALFLSHFDVSGLAVMVVVASILSILAGVAGARLMSYSAPGRVIPRGFLASAGLLMLGWGLAFWSHSVAAVVVYLQIAVLGSVLISGFWSLLGDRFDPHTARKQFGRIVAAGTFGGVIGGLLAERIGTSLGVTAMLPVLAAMDLICAFLTSGLGASFTPAGIKPAPTVPKFSAFRILRNEPYLRNLALLVVVTTIGAGLLDYVFKARAVAAHNGGGDLVRFFAIFYTGVGLMTFLVQIALSKPSLEKLGLAGTIGTLPFAVALGSFGGIIIPGLGSATLARGNEAILRSSLFRSGYELFFAAVPRRDRRETKPILDIGFERLGDMLSGLLISALLLAGSRAAIPVMLVTAFIAGIAGLWISRRLHRGYVKALENNLMNQSIHLDISDIRDSTTRTAVMQTLGNLMPAQETRSRVVTIPVIEPPRVLDPMVQRVIDLRSTDATIVRNALSQALDATLASHAIGLLAWNAVADDAVRALQKIESSITGQLVDALLDPAQEFAVRRRIPRVLSVSTSSRAFEGLTQGLFDKRFEVRFQTGRALAQMQDRSPDIPVNRELVLKAVLEELSVDREVWDNRSVIDAGEQETSSVSFEHLFRLLSLILSRDALKVAYRGLNSGDKHLKGMALEYLESVLPGEVRGQILPILEV